MQIPTFTSWSRQTRFEYFIGLCIALTGAFLLTQNTQLFFVFIVGSSLLVFIACRYPLVLIVGHFIATIFPLVLHNCFENTIEWRVLTQGVGVNDIILGAMFVAVAVRLTTTFFLSSRSDAVKSPFNDKRLTLSILGLCLWFLYEIVRNLDVHGLSSPGEFRSHYLILALPVYIAIFFDSEKSRKNLFKTALFLCLIVPVLFIPVIGEIKGWSIGAKSRFFPAMISFGILQGVLFCLLSIKWRMFKIPTVLLLPFLIVGALIIIFDTHRSVWFPAIAMIFAYFRFSQMELRQVLNKSLGYVLIIVAMSLMASAVVTSVLNIELFDFIVDRSSELFALNMDYETTWTWRIEKWKIELAKIVDFPFTGLGFGGYWGLEELVGDDGVTPHNLYVQVIVKLGLVGLFFYLMTMGLVFKRIYYGMAKLKAVNDPEFVLLVSAIIALIGSHIHYLAYGFDEYSFFFVGLGMAVIRSKSWTFSFTSGRCET